MLLPSLADLKFSPLDQANPSILLESVIEVHDQYDRNGMKPGSEKWIADTRVHRKRLIDDITQVWQRISRAECICPWHDDYIANIWTAFRKCNQNDKALFRDMFGLPAMPRPEAVQTEV